MKGMKGQFVKRPMMFGAEHLGGKKFVQYGAYVHKEKETRRHRTGGRPHGRDRPMG
jgi:hypothetical protein